jgi:hypothetical protein
MKTILLALPFMLCIIFSDTKADADDECVAKFFFGVTAVAQNVVTFRVKDNSMSPLMETDDECYGDGDLPFEDGRVYIADLKEHSLMVRTVNKTSDGYKLTAKNKEYPPIVAKKEIIRSLVRVIKIVAHDGDRFLNET